MTRMLSISLLTLLACVFGIVSAFADGAMEYYWLQPSLAFSTSTFIILIGILGNAAGVWGLMSVYGSFIVARRFRRLVTTIVSGVLVLILAILAYYTTIIIGNLRPDASLSSAAISWLLLAIPVGIVSGFAGYGLARPHSGWLRPYSLFIITSYVLLDCFIFWRSQGGIMGEPFLLAIAIYVSSTVIISLACFRLSPDLL